MGARGPRPQPTALRVLRGNPGKRALNKQEPKPTVAKVRPPAHLTAEARREWRRVLPELERLGLLTVVDRAALAGYCQAYARWVEAEEKLSEYGMVGVTPSGYVQQLPYVSIAQKQLDLMRRFAAEFGFSPASRSRVSTADTAEADPFEQWVRGA